MNRSQVTLEHEAEGSSFVLIRARGLSLERLKPYREAVEGARYDRARRAQIAPLDRIPTILVRLRDACFHVSVAPRLVVALQSLSGQQWLDLKSAQDRASKIDEVLRAKGLHLYPFQRLGVQWLATRHAALLADEQGLGKAQPVDEIVLTPQGWRAIGSLRVGERVIGSTGHAVRVTGVFPQGVRRILRVTLNDGSAVRASEDHLWTVRTRRSMGRLKRVTTAEMMAKGLRYKNGNGDGHMFWLPLVGAVHFDRRADVEMGRSGWSMAPYLLGALVANGGFRTNTPTHSGDEQQREALRPFLPRGYSFRRSPSDEWVFRITAGDRSRMNLVRRALLEAELWWKESHERFVPERYLFGSVKDRIRLLQGLMDNDGTVDLDGMVVEYNTTSPKLAEQVLFLVRSLGGTAWMSERIPLFVDARGKKSAGRLDHRIRMALPEGLCPFRIPRKVERYVPRSKYPAAHAVERIDEAGEAECVCISVDAPDHLYVTRDLVVTHNTVQAIAAVPAGVPVLVVAPAVAKGVWVREVARWRPHLKVSMLAGRDSFRWPERGEMVVTNYDILPEIHQAPCDGKLPPRPCVSCGPYTNHMGIKVKAPPGTHEPGCTGFLEREDCPGCHKILELPLPETVAVVDEAQALKGGKARRTKRFRALSEGIRRKSGRVWLLTGTPMMNEPKELWSVYKAAGVAEEAFGDWHTFVRLFNGKALFFGGYEWGSPEAEVIERIRRVSLRRKREEVLPDLPVKTHREIVVDVDRKALAECDRFLGEHGGIERVLALIEASGIRFETMSRVRQALAMAKTPALLALVKVHEENNPDSPLVVFSAHRFPIDQLGKRPGWRVITGDTPAAERTEIEDVFQAGKLKGVACTIKAGGVAITLTRSHYAIYVDREFTPAWNAQSEDRICRIGQTRGCMIDVLVANHQLDQRVSELLTRKQTLIEQSVDAARERERVYEHVDTEAEAALAERTEEPDALIRKLRRPARTAAERWAEAQLHALDFNPSDKRVALSLAEELSAVGLSDAQWDLSIRICKRYPAAGACPEEGAAA